MAKSGCVPPCVDKSCAVPVVGWVAGERGSRSENLLRGAMKENANSWVHAKPKNRT